MNRTNLSIFESLRNFLINGPERRDLYCSSPNDFTRTRRFTFPVTALIVLQLLQESLALEIHDFFGRLGADESFKSGFCKARRKIRHLFFLKLNDCLLDAFYGVGGRSVHKWKGFRLLGVDGTTLSLPDLPHLGKRFGRQITSGRSVVMARMLCCYDLLNDLVVHADVGPLRRGEGKMAFRLVRKLAGGKDLLVYDRGFPSFVLFFLHLHHGVEFLARCKVGFNKEVKAFLASGQRSQVVAMKSNSSANKKLAGLGFCFRQSPEVRVRLIRVELANGEVEVLATSLTDEKRFPHCDFGDLYRMRWGVEVYFDRLKNTFQANFFNGKSTQCIYQEAYAAVMLTNVQSLLTREADKMAEQKYKGRKHPYKVNRSTSLGILKAHMAALFLGRKLGKVIGCLVSEFVKHVEPVRPGRKYPRSKKHPPPKNRNSPKPAT